MSIWSNNKQSNHFRKLKLNFPGITSMESISQGVGKITIFKKEFSRIFFFFFRPRPSCECIRWWLKWQVTRSPLPLVNKERKYSVRFECRRTSHRVIGWNRIALARFDHFQTIYLPTTLNFDCMDFNDIKLNWRWNIFRKF